MPMFDPCGPCCTRILIFMGSGSVAPLATFYGIIHGIQTDVFNNSSPPPADIDLGQYNLVVVYPSTIAYPAGLTAARLLDWLNGGNKRLLFVGAGNQGNYYPDPGLPQINTYCAALGVSLRHNTDGNVMGCANDVTCQNVGFVGSSYLRTGLTTWSTGSGAFNNTGFPPYLGNQGYYGQSITGIVTGGVSLATDPNFVFYSYRNYTIPGPGGTHTDITDSIIVASGASVLAVERLPAINSEVLLTSDPPAFDYGDISGRMLSSNQIFALRLVEVDVP